MRIAQVSLGGLAERLDDALLLLAFDGSIVDANVAAQECYGYSVEELRTLTMHDICDQPDPETVAEYMRLVVAGSPTRLVHRRKDGSTFPVEVRGIEVAADTERALLCVVRDVNAGEAATGTREQTTRTLLDAIDGSALLMDPDGRIVAINEVAAVQLGECDAGKMIGTNAFDYVSPEAALRHRALTERVLQTGLPETFEDHRDGRRVVSSLNPVLVDGRITQLAVFGYDMTDIDQGVEALRQSEQWLRESQRIAHLGHYVYRIDTDHWDCSPALADVFGISEEYNRDFEGWLALSHPDEREKLSRYFTEEVLGRRLPFDLEYRVVRPVDGEERIVHGLGTVEWDPEGQPLQMFGVIQDITERVRAEEESRASERRFRRLFEQVPVALVLLDEQGRLLLANERFTEMFGWQQGEITMIDEWWLLAYPDEEYRREVMLTWNEDVRLAIAENRDIKPREYTVTCKNGDELIIEISGIELEDGLLATFRDLTVRKHTEQQLRQTSAYLKSLIGSARGPIMVWDSDQRITLFNHAFERLTGRLAADVIGEKLGVLFPDDTRQASLEEISRATGGTFWEAVEIPIMRADGAVRTVLWNSANVFDTDGTTLLGVVAQGQDITRRKRAEDDLRRERALLVLVEAIAHVGSWRIDLLSGEHSWSDEAIRILGSDPEDFGGRVIESLRAVAHPEDQALFDEPDLQSKWTSGSRAIDFRVMGPDGVRWLCAQAEAELDDSGQPVAINGTLQDLTERKLAEDRRVSTLEQAANIDRLTGLRNRRGFDLIAEQAIAQARRSSLGIGLIYCDVDNLKMINDEFGHAQGDRALQDAASILRFTLRSADAMARVGGDEFIVLAQGDSEEALERLNERLQEGFDFFNATNQRPYTLAMSSGTAWCEPGTRCRLEELKSLADAQMYGEKLRRREA